MSTLGSAFAEEAPEATVQITPEITPEATPEVSPEASLPFGRRQETPLVGRIASILNMKEEDLISARHEGKSFTQIAEEKGISEKELLDALTEDMKAFLDTQVAQGKLTSEQSAANLSKMEENLRIALSRTEVGPPETRPNIGRNIGGENTPRMQRAHGRAHGGRHGSMRGFSQGVQTGRNQGQGQGQGICPCCGRALQPAES